MPDAARQAVVDDLADAVVPILGAGRCPTPLTFECSHNREHWFRSSASGDARRRHRDFGDLAGHLVVPILGVGRCPTPPFTVL